MMIMRTKKTTSTTVRFENSNEEKEAWFKIKLDITGRSHQRYQNIIAFLAISGISYIIGTPEIIGKSYQVNPSFLGFSFGPITILLVYPYMLAIGICYLIAMELIEYNYVNKYNNILLNYLSKKSSNYIERNQFFSISVVRILVNCIKKIFIPLLQKISSSIEKIIRLLQKIE